ncbi:MAG TPA: flagellar M-ring protein FliF C-terminal domain-containing protein, partial [Verrucomicrobiae bacterium]|nr:flagellar M-ring protein FliF C-terminal domain-containing protein [Verrucomicrobiae bacterium]
SWNVAFTPTADNAIVEEGRRNDLLLRLSLAGVPHEHVETTEQAMAGVGALTPQAVIDAQTRTGLAGDIEDGLRGVAGVDDARVIVVPAKSAEFADETARDASASVRLRLRAGARLSRAAVAGIRAYVAAAVAGLSPAHVTLLDDAGLALGDGDDAADSADLERELQSALDQAFGSGSAIVRVRTEYRASSLALREERRAPIGGALIERTGTDERYEGDGKRYARSAAQEVRGTQTSESVSQSGPGALARISTAVFVDRARAGEIAQIRELAAATVGFDARRGDALAVEAVDFARPLAARKDIWWLLYGALVPLLPAVAFGLCLLAAARFATPPLAAAARALVERLALARTAKAVAGCAPARVRSALEREPPHAAAIVISALPAATAAAVLDLYPAHEREAIVRRMQRPHSPLFPSPEEIVQRYDF